MSGRPTKSKPKVYRQGKTQEDRMPVGQRPRVAAAQRRLATAQQEKAR